MEDGDKTHGLVIIPAYNEEEAIVQTVRDIEKKALSIDYIVINDCSTDHTRELLEQNHLNHVNLPINSGIGGAIQTGYLYAEKHGYKCAFQMDGDGQHDALFLEDMIHELKDDEADMIIGSRFIQHEGFQFSCLRRIGTSFFTWWIRCLTGQTVTDPTSGMRLCNRKIIHLFRMIIRVTIRNRKRQL